jgi:uncharacterized membrane protein
MFLVRWLLTVLLATVALTVDVGNAIAPMLARKQRRNISAVPLVGALSGFAACLVCPLAGSAKLIPLVVLLDLSVYHLARLAIRSHKGRPAKPD